MTNEDREVINQMFAEQQRRLESAITMFHGTIKEANEIVARDADARAEAFRNDEESRRRAHKRADDHLDLERRQTEAWERIAGALEALASR